MIYSCIANVKCVSRHEDHLAISASFPPSISIYSISMQSIIGRVPAENPFSCISFNGNIVVAGFNQVLSYWNLTDFKRNDIDLKSSRIHNIEWLDNERLHVLCMFTCGDWIIMDLSTKVEMLRISSAQELSSGHLSRTTKGFMVHTGYKNGSVRQWILTKSSLKYETRLLNHYHTLQSEITCMSSYGNILVTGSWNGRIKVFDDCFNVRTLKTHDTSPILSIDIKDRNIITGHYNSSVTLWDFP